MWDNVAPSRLLHDSPGPRALPWDQAIECRPVGPKAIPSVEDSTRHFRVGGRGQTQPFRKSCSCHNLLMGFALQIASMSEMLEPAEEQELRGLLARHHIDFREELDLSHFSGELFDVLEPGIEEYEEDGRVVSVEETGASVASLEVGWSWWSNAQVRIADLLGDTEAEPVFDVHAWRGVSVPSDINGTILGQPVTRSLKPKPLLERLGLKKPTSDDLMARLIDAQVLQHGGPYDNFCVASTPRLIRVLERTIEAANLSHLNPVQVYESVDFEDDLQTANCTILLFHRFLAVAQAHRHLVWWIK